MELEKKREIVWDLNEMWRVFQEVCPCSITTENNPIEEFLEAKGRIHQILADDKEHADIDL